MGTNSDYSMLSIASYEQFKTSALESIIAMFKSGNIELDFDTRQYAVDYIDRLSVLYGLSKSLRLKTERFKFEDDGDGNELITEEYVKYGDAEKVINDVIDKLTLCIVHITTTEIKDYLTREGVK